MATDSAPTKDSSPELNKLVQQAIREEFHSFETAEAAFAAIKDLSVQYTFVTLTVSPATGSKGDLEQKPSTWSEENGN